MYLIQIIYTWKIVPLQKLNRLQLTTCACVYIWSRRKPFCCRDIHSQRRHTFTCISNTRWMSLVWRMSQSLNQRKIAHRSSQLLRFIWIVIGYLLQCHILLRYCYHYQPSHLFQHFPLVDPSHVTFVTYAIYCK